MPQLLLTHLAGAQPAGRLRLVRQPGTGQDAPAGRLRLLVPHLPAIGSISDVSATWVIGSKYVDGRWRTDPAGLACRFWIRWPDGSPASETARSTTGTARVRMRNAAGTGDYVPVVEFDD